ncbi:predicted protein [Uncinocarpus reesii 1704]|uniref:Mid2 domain-containing protein n=1 Tax=Uncinocarpus reesii (strain UAMH 1704) TaxID=336963 RepID=C4JTN3_UNCRE|nr:uncharacterized protein UREG_05822 [Uncinocarpus reesii 1704]EEP80980.1 predicted protein [Uncinocarpus reesii 1704]
MRRSICSSLLALLATTPFLSIHASPFPTPAPHNNILINRDCANPCGFYGQVCCEPSQQCYTDSNGQAACRTNAEQAESGGQWEYFTTVVTQTDLVVVTSTGSRYVFPTSPGNAQCDASLGESPCGDICCTAAQSCNGKGVCIEGGSSPFPSPSPPVRPTSGVTVTATDRPTKTTGFIPAISTDGSTLVPITKGGGGLSGGAIAGIVIGSLAGAFVLLLLCFCFCVGSLASRVRGLFGGGRHKPSVYSESSFTDSGSHIGGGAHGGWYGGRPPSSKPKKSSWGWLQWLSVSVIFGAILVCLGLKRHSKESEKSYSYYTETDYTSPESSSTGPSSGRGKGDGGPGGAGPGDAGRVAGGSGGHGRRIIYEHTETYHAPRRGSSRHGGSGSGSRAVRA